MAWNSVAASSSVIDHDEWNSMVTYITDDAADLATHTSDSTIHFTVDSINLDELSDVSAPSPTSGNSLIWNGIAWIDAFVSGQGSNIAGNPAGIDTQVQFNDNGNFGADSNFTWNSITNTLNIAGSISSQKISSNKILTSEINSVNNLYISSLTDNINIIAYDSLYLKSKWKGIHLYAPYEGISISSLNGDIKVYADGTNIIINTERISGGSFLPIWPREVINKRWAERQFKPSTATGDGGTGGYPSGPRHAIQFKSGTSTSHGGDWHLTYSPLTNRFALTGGAWIKGSLSSQNISSNKIRSFYISTNHLSSNSLYGYIISCHTWKGPTIGGGDGASAFIDLTDVPNSYAGKIGRLPIVNATSDGLIFAEIVCVDNQIVFNDNSVVWA